jgi:hypothetical protein
LIGVLCCFATVAVILYAFQLRSRIFRWYAQLRNVKPRVTGSRPAAPAEPGPAAVSELEQAWSHENNKRAAVRAPTGCTAAANIALVR